MVSNNKNNENTIRIWYFQRNTTQWHVILWHWPIRWSLYNSHALRRCLDSSVKIEKSNRLQPVSYRDSRVPSKRLNLHDNYQWRPLSNATEAESMLVTDRRTNSSTHLPLCGAGVRDVRQASVSKPTH